MKILYATQRTGNGHIARAQEIIPILEKFAQVDILASGTNSQLKLGYKINYSFNGISLFYNEGKVSYFNTFIKNNFIQFLFNAITFPTSSYDLIINDFEPVSAWACKLKGGNIISLSHQASLLFIETPKPQKSSLLGSVILKYFAPSKIKYGFHFKSYHSNIILPIIRKKIRDLLPINSVNNYLVYLPSFNEKMLIECLTQIATEWHVFTNETKKKYTFKNITFYPINENLFLQKLASCSGVLCNAGFELPTEALYLKKKLFVIPIKLQYEQLFNAISACEVGAKSSFDLNIEAIRNWVENEQETNFNYCKNPEQVIFDIINKHI